MTKIYGRNFIGGLLLALAFFSTPAVQAKPELTEEQIIAELSSPKEAVITSALQKLEKQFPTSPTAIAAVKKFLTDDRIKVKCKAARVLGAIHADVSAAEVASICTLLKSSTPEPVLEGLKSLRGLKAPGAIAEITPLLKSANPKIVRDSCRALAVLGDKSLVPLIQPLLQVPDLGVQKDAADAISILKEK